MQFQNQYGNQRQYTYEVDSRGSSLEKDNGMNDYLNIEKINKDRLNNLNYQVNEQFKHMQLPSNNSIQSTSINQSLPNLIIDNNNNENILSNNNNQKYDSYKSYLDNKYKSNSPNNIDFNKYNIKTSPFNTNEYNSINPNIKNKINQNTEDEFNEKYDYKPRDRRRGSSKSATMRENNNLQTDNSVNNNNNNMKRIRSHSIGDIEEKSENYPFNNDSDIKFLSKGNNDFSSDNNNKLRNTNNISQNNLKKNIILDTLSDPNYTNQLNNMKIAKGTIKSNDYLNNPTFSTNSNAILNMNKRNLMRNTPPQGYMDSNERNMFNPNENYNQFYDKKFSPFYNPSTNELFKNNPNMMEPYLKNGIKNPFVNEFDNRNPYNTQMMENNPYNSSFNNPYNQNPYLQNYSDPRFNNMNNYPLNQNNPYQELNNTNNNLSETNNNQNNNNEDYDPDNILAQVQYINPDHIKNKPPNEQILLLANNNKELYNALKTLQGKYNMLKDEYLKLLKIQESAKDNTKFKDLLMKDNEDLKRENKNYEDIIEPLVDYLNDVNSSLGKSELDLLDLKRLAKKYKAKKLGEVDEEEMNPLEKFKYYVNKWKNGIVNIIEGEPNKIKGKIPKLNEGKRKIITFSDKIKDDNNNDLNNLQNPNDILKNKNKFNPNQNYYNNEYENSDNENNNNKLKKLRGNPNNKKNKNKDFYYWKKNKFIRGKSGRIITDSDEEVIEEKRRINKFMIGDDKTYSYDYYGNRIWDCPACSIGINNSSRGFSPLMCSPHKDYYIQNKTDNNNDKNDDDDDIE